MNTTKDKVHPTTKSATFTTTTTSSANGTTTTTTTPAAAAATATANLKIPPTRAQQLTGTTRHRPAPPPRHHNNHHRRGCRRCCLWMICATFIITALLVILAAIPATVFYALYRPRPPSFSLTALKITQLNLTSTDFSSKVTLKMDATNPNQKFIFYYNQINTTVLAHCHQNTIILGQTSLPAFVHWGKNTTTLSTMFRNNNNSLLDGSSEILKSELLKNKGLNLKVKMETQMRIKFGEKMTSNKAGLTVLCDGIKADVIASNSKGNLTGIVMKTSVLGVECKVHFTIKIFEWNVHI